MDLIQGGMGIAFGDLEQGKQLYYKWVDIERGKGLTIFSEYYSFEASPEKLGLLDTRNGCLESLLEYPCLH